MLNYSEHQLDILRKIGVDVWKLRANAHAEISQSGEVVETDVVSEEKVVEQQPEKKPVATQSQSQPQPQPQPQPESQPTMSAKKSPPKTSAKEAKGAGSVEASDLSSLDLIKQAVSACQKCELHKSRTNAVSGVGNPDADWFFVGEAPGQNEDLQGEPFVGRAGKLLDQMIAALGMTREQVFIANILKCRPPNNRDPVLAEVDQCEPYLHQQLALIKPKVIVALGRISAQTLLRTDKPIGKLRGNSFQYGANNIPLVVTYHPAYLLRSPRQKAVAWEDLWMAREIVRG